MKILNKNLVFIPLIIASLNAEELCIDSLLKDIEIKTDLSEKTKLANGGISFIYTRDDIQRMQVKYLKDILKSTHPFGYTENRYGLPDPMFLGSNQLFTSSNIRIFIDNQEITTSLYGSGLAIMGDIDIGFVDHIEVYTQNPSYEFSTEPTFLLIKLYSKKASRDEGSKVELNSGSYGSSRVSGYLAHELKNDWSYFTYLSLNNDNRKKYESYGSELSRDKEVSHFFGSFYNENNNILIESISSKKDSFIDLSDEATPSDANIDFDSLHIGYDIKTDDLSFLATYSYMDESTGFSDDINDITSHISKSTSDVYSTEFKYNFNTTNNKTIAGIKYRLKSFKYKTLQKDNVDYTSLGHSYQSISSVFVENQYSLKENSIINMGIEYTDVKNNNSIQQDELLQYRLGHTYTNSNWTNKIIHSHIETSLETYLVNSYDFYITNGKKESQEMDSFIENIIYQKFNNKYELILDYMRIKNYLLPVESGLIDNYKEKVTVKGLNFMWTHDYNDYDKLFISLGYMETNNMPSVSLQKTYTGILRNINTYKKFDIFNELLYYKDSVNNKDYVDYSAGVKYHYSDDLTISFKGENLFDKAKTTSYKRVDPVTNQLEVPLEISSVDRKVMITLEYLF